MERSNRVAFYLAFVFLAGNKWLHVRVLLFIFLIAVIGGVVAAVLGPFVLPLFIFVVLVLYFSANYYYAQEVPHVTSYEQMREVARTTTFSELLFVHLAEGFALSVAAVLFWLLNAVVLWGLLYSAFGAGLDALLLDPITSTYAAGAYWLLAVYFFVTSIFLYGAMGAYGSALMAGGGFWPTFKGALRFLSPRFWRATFNIRYFKLVVGWELVQLAIVVVGRTLKFALFVLLSAMVVPKGAQVGGDAAMVVSLTMAFAITEIIANIANILVSYLLSYYSSGVAVFAYELLEE